MDAGGPAKDVKLPPPTDMIPLGGRLLRGARGGPILMLMQATRYIEFRVDGIEGRPDLSARHIQDGLDGFWGSDRLDIFDASKRQLTSLPLEKADKGSNIKDADGRIVGHLGLTQDDPPKIMAKISPEVLKQFPLPPTTGEAPKSETVGADPTVKPDASPKAPTEQQSYGFVTKTQEEADLVGAMIAQGKNQNEIQAALDDLRVRKGVDFRQAATVKPEDLFPSNTQPTGPLGGKPFGKPETIQLDARAEGKRGIRAQNAALDRLADAGYRIVRQPTVTRGVDGTPVLTAEMQDRLGLKKDKNPDALIEGRVFDVYSPSNAKSKNIIDEIYDKVQGNQAHRIVLNLQDSDVSVRELRQELMETPIPKLKEIIIIDKNGVISHFFPFKG